MRHLGPENRLKSPKPQIVSMTSCPRLCSQIYNEMIRDLLNPSSGFLDLREDSKGVIQVAGITEVSTINAQEVSAASCPCTASLRPPVITRERPSVLFQIMELLMKGNKQRTQEPTAANQTSSRSHAVLQVAVRQQSRCRDVLQEVRFARLFMIDLAGSERAAQVRGDLEAVCWVSLSQLSPWKDQFHFYSTFYNKNGL